MPQQREDPAGVRICALFRKVAPESRFERLCQVVHGGFSRYRERSRNYPAAVRADALHPNSGGNTD